MPRADDHTTRQVVFFLEEESAREMLECVLPKIIPQGEISIDYKYVTFRGKNDMKKTWATG